ncbi:MAG: Mrp/NBP35 family ATP-binding protein [Bacteroidales bacterium]|nr:Mrp/NBP35 family ATP-binding protein [Bacteroidales bacterium]
MVIDKSKILEALKSVNFPNKNKDIVSLGLVKELEVNSNQVSFTILIPNLNSPFKKAIEATAKDAIHRFVSQDIEVKIFFEEDEEFKKTQPGGVSGIKHIIAVASGKGGVGKSTITSNLAITLVKKGYSVGLIDADIFGPSMPKMFGVEGEVPVGRKEGTKDLIVPVEKYGVKLLSIGFFVKPEDAVAWRGPMAGNALKQLIDDSDWGALDFLLIDLPPGTSDIQLTLVQTLSITGAIIVTTPQDVAVIDAVKGIDFFTKDKVEVPILGIVENMAWFTPAELPENRYYIFGKGGGKALAEKKGLPLLAQIPIVQSIREGGDEGLPVALQENTLLSESFNAFTHSVLVELDKRLSHLPQTQRVKIHM